MGRRSAAAKRSKAGSGRNRARPTQCRAWRPLPGPPAHVVERQVALELKFADRKRAAAEAAATLAITKAGAVVVPFRRPASVPSVALKAGSAVAPLPIVRRALLTERRIAACLFLLPSLVTAAFASLIASRSDAPIPAGEIVVASHPAPAVERPREIDFAAMLPAPVLPTSPPRIDPPGEIQFSTLRLPDTPPDVPPIFADVIVPPRDFALAATAPTFDTPPVAIAVVVPPSPVSITALGSDLTPPVAVDGRAPVSEQCTAEAGFTLRANAKLPEASPAPESETAAAFGVRLANVARAQTASLVIYNARYATIAYPAGDVSPFYGVCTDVVVRAYRALGVDLQVEVAEAAVGTGDRNIDHRRVEVIRKFMSKRGESLAPSDNPDDYLPGDIVTYYRPQNKSSTTHIAIVADQIGPSGQPMIVHNRGWGVQLEDALFVDKITGHYRYRPKPRGADPLIALAKLKAPLASSTADAPRIRPKTPDGAALAKAGLASRALR